LPQDEPITEATLLAIVLTTKSDTRIRELTCQRLQKLADFAGIQIDLKPYEGIYDQRSVKPRNVPNDDLIVEWRDKIPNASWQWLYGMLATFGVRPH
jgi:hypothetical protein